MAFNLGSFKAFPGFVKAVKAGDWHLAAKCLMFVKVGQPECTELYLNHEDRWAEMCRRLVTEDDKEAPCQD